jgi:hypothetical protein
MADRRRTDAERQRRRREKVRTVTPKIHLVTRDGAEVTRDIGIEDKTGQDIQVIDTTFSPSGDGASQGKYPEQFERAWKSYPHFKGRSSKPKALMAWQRLEQAVQEVLPEACARFAREGREPRTEWGAPGMHKWLSDEKFIDWLQGAAVAPSAARFPNATIRDAAVHANGEGWAVSYIDRCTWDEPAKTIFCPHGFVVERLARQLPELERIGVKIVVDPARARET